ncbi:MAG TPA: 30S ribosomal protein S20 [Thermoanaerobaculia bacterium]|nr:30S ribosomal protein S20 [Thermoanaerobaculia bacterium]
MANIKSAKKRIRTSAKKTARNRRVKTKLRHVIKKHRSSPSAETLPGTASEIDRAAAKGVIHPNTAARYKSRLAKATKSRASS